MGSRVRISPVPTERGFLRAQTPDFYGNDFVVQESSSMTPCLWFGPNECTEHLGSHLNRVHLSRAHVRELVRVMDHWLRTGRLPRGRRAKRAVTK